MSTLYWCPHQVMKATGTPGKFVWGNMAKHCWVMSTNFLFSKVCWQHPAMFCHITSSKISCQNLNFHWRQRWWDQIQIIFLNLFYFRKRLQCAPAQRIRLFPIFRAKIVKVKRVPNWMLKQGQPIITALFLQLNTKMGPQPLRRKI